MGAGRGVRRVFCGVDWSGLSGDRGGVGQKHSRPGDLDDRSRRLALRCADGSGYYPLCSRPAPGHLGPAGMECGAWNRRGGHHDDWGRHLRSRSRASSVGVAVRWAARGRGRAASGACRRGCRSGHVFYEGPALVHVRLGGRGRDGPIKLGVSHSMSAVGGASPRSSSSKES